MICFIFSTTAFLGTTLYLILAMERGLLNQQDMPYLAFVVVIAVLPSIGLGLFLRQRRLRKINDLRKYEYVLQLAGGEND